jgi:hypothetical protein
MVVSSSLMPTQQADTCPKKCQVNFFVELTVKLNSRTKLTHIMHIQELFSRFSLMRTRMRSELHIERSK